MLNFSVSSVIHLNNNNNETLDLWCWADSWAVAYISRRIVRLKVNIFVSGSEIRRRIHNRTVLTKANSQTNYNNKTNG